MLFGNEGNLFFAAIFFSEIKSGYQFIKIISTIFIFEFTTKT